MGYKQLQKHSTDLIREIIAGKYRHSQNIAVNDFDLVSTVKNNL